MAAISDVLPLVHEHIAYNDVTGEFSWLIQPRKYTPSVLVWRPRHQDYCIPFKECRLQAKRLAWYFVYGVYPAERVIQLDGDPANLAIANLRLRQVQDTPEIAPATDSIEDCVHATEQPSVPNVSDVTINTVDTVTSQTALYLYKGDVYIVNEQDTQKFIIQVMPSGALLAKKYTSRDFLIIHAPQRLPAGTTVTIKQR